MARARIHPTPAEAEANGWLCCRDLKARHRLMPGYSTCLPAASGKAAGPTMYTIPPIACPGNGSRARRSFGGRAAAARAQALIEG
jgi:hypothetical protein